MNYLENTELKDTMIGKGILQEVNRVFFHPLGLCLAIIYFEDGGRTDLKMQQMADGDEFIFENLDKFKMYEFREFANKRFEEREDKLGFIIQIDDISEDDKNYKANKTIKTKRIETILKNLSMFFYGVQHKFMTHHESHDRDNIFIGEASAKLMLDSALVDEDWESVAAWAMIMRRYKELNEEISSLEMDTTNV
jgi:hypothetical protein